MSEKQRGKRVGHRSFGRRAEIIISALLWKDKTVLPRAFPESPCKSHFLHNQGVSEREREGHEKRATECEIEREERETRAPQQ